MTRKNSYFLHWTCGVACIIFLTPCKHNLADEPFAFDAPATCSAKEEQSPSDGQKNITIAIPISLNLKTETKAIIRELQIEIQWHCGAFQITDYQPRTTMQSDIVGTIKVEDRQDKNASLGVDLSSGYFDAVGGKVGIQAGQKQGKTRRYEETPEHAILVTSGTIKRGTGVNFCFNPSRTSTLQGSRELSISCRVPENWRGGILLVKCRAKGTKKFLGAFDDDFHMGSAFVVPIFLSGDAEARDAASEFMRTEQRLRSDWQHYQKTAPPNNLSRQWHAVVGRADHKVPEIWVHQLIQAGNDEWLEKYRQRLPSYIASSATKFVEARRELVQIGR